MLTDLPPDVLLALWCHCPELVPVHMAVNRKLRHCLPDVASILLDIRRPCATAAVTTGLRRLLCSAPRKTQARGRMRRRVPEQQQAAHRRAHVVVHNGPGLQVVAAVLRAPLARGITLDLSALASITLAPETFNTMLKVIERCGSSLLGLHLRRNELRAANMGEQCKAEEKSVAHAHHMLREQVSWRRACVLAHGIECVVSK